MRHNQNRRSRGRSRKTPNPLTRSYESNGPDVKVRGTPAHIAEKYGALARDAHSSGDRIAAESYFQHAEHYNRIVAAAQLQQAQQTSNRDNSGDEDGDDETRAQPREERPEASAQGENGRGDREGDQRRRGRRPQRPENSDTPAGTPVAAEKAETNDGEVEEKKPRRKPRKSNGHESPSTGTAAQADDVAVQPDPANAGGDEAGREDEDITKDGAAALAAFPD